MTRCLRIQDEPAGTYNLSMPVFLTLFVTKAILKLVRLTGRGGGSALPGLIAERIDRRIIAKLTKELPKGVVIVTGTNGKTTTAKMLVAILQQAGKKVITNRSGSNLTRGIASTLVEHVRWNGSLREDTAVFEVDEATMPAACRLLEPSVIVVLNLFRDQLDRYGELDKTAAMIGEGISASMAEVYLNADDPLVASLAKYVQHPASVRYFGVENSPGRRLEHDHAVDSGHCPECGKALQYSQNFFSHIGHYTCPAGDFKRPKPLYGLISQPSRGEGSRFEVVLPQGRASFYVELPGLYNSYNALAAIAVGCGFKLQPGQIATALQVMKAAFGRVERIQLGGRQVYLLLIKNPTGFNQVIQTFLVPHPDRNLLVAINDNFADGRDVSWLWDVAFEDIKGWREVIASGVRASDLALRLKYAETKAEIEPDLGRAVKRLISVTPEGETCYILPTYTAMLGLRKLISKEGELEGFWK
jgi:lipid II isoglutaminyl synthase (glutamine-hydrolysing)